MTLLLSSMALYFKSTEISQKWLLLKIFTSLSKLSTSKEVCPYQNGRLSSFHNIYLTPLCSTFEIRRSCAEKTSRAKHYHLVF